MTQLAAQLFTKVSMAEADISYGPPLSGLWWRRKFDMVLNSYVPVEGGRRRGLPGYEWATVAARNGIQAGQRRTLRMAEMAMAPGTNSMSPSLGPTARMP